MSELLAFYQLFGLGKKQAKIIYSRVMTDNIVCTEVTGKYLEDKFVRYQSVHIAAACF